MAELVSCIMPCSRPDDLIRAIPLFVAQDYPNKELLILMDDEGYTKDTSIENRIHQWGIPSMVLGSKRNHLCEHAHGDIILHLDSDDFYASDWITKSVAALQGADMTGLTSGWFYKPHTNLWRYDYPKKAQPYVLGATMCYWKRTWERNRFKNVASGEDAFFCANAGRIKPHEYITGFMAMRHGANTSGYGVEKHAQQYEPEYARHILGDWYDKF